MRKVTNFLAIALLGTTMMSFAATPDCKTNCEEQVIDGITYIEPTEEVQLDFDTAKYLPEGFDAYKGMGPNLDEVVFIEPEEEIEFDFNPARYLPIGFDAYEGMIIDIDQVEYIEEEEEIELDFNSDAYLPADFEASSK